jgi:hypothetical protein
VYSAAQVGGSVYLLQTSLGLPLADELNIAFGGGIGVFNSALAYEAQGQFSWTLSENFSLNLAVNYQPWRFDVLPLRGGLGLEWSPGFGVLKLSGFAGLNQTNVLGWGVRLVYRIRLEELFPSPEAEARR